VTKSSAIFEPSRRLVEVAVRVHTAGRDERPAGVDLLRRRSQAAPIATMRPVANAQVGTAKRSLAVATSAADHQVEAHCHLLKRRPQAPPDAAGVHARQAQRFPDDGRDAVVDRDAQFGLQRRHQRRTAQVGAQNDDRIRPPMATSRISLHAGASTSENEKLSCRPRCRSATQSKPRGG
jgi:hypothetical protein